MTWTLLNSFFYALVALLVIVDPPGTAVVFAAMTQSDTAAERASQARRACLVGGGVLAVFGLAGASLLQALGIGLPAMRIAGGALLFLTAAEMVMDRHALRSTDSERQAAMHTDQDIAIFPLGIPLIAGPGAMTTMVVLHSQTGGDPWRVAAIEAAVLACILITLASVGEVSLARHGRDRCQRGRARARRSTRGAGGADWNSGTARCVWIEVGRKMSKLLPTGTARDSARRQPRSLRRQKFFGSFFQKRTTCLLRFPFSCHECPSALS